MMLSNKLEELADAQLEQWNKFLKYSDRDFANAVIIFQSALMDKMFQLQLEDKLTTEQALFMSEACGKELHKLIKTFTSLDTKGKNFFSNK